MVRLEIRKRVGYFSSYLPPEIIWACGLTPLRLRPDDSLAAADGYLPRNFSVEARGLLAAALDGGFSIDDGQALEVEAVVFIDEDDTSRRLYDVWRAYADIPALGLVSLPRLGSGLACLRYAGALEELASLLSGFSAQSLSEQGLGRAIEQYNEQRALWRALRQRWIESSLTASEWYDLRWLALTLDPDLANRELAARLDDAVLPNTGEGSETSPRLLVLGGMQVPRPFLTFLEGCGARVVAEDSEADERTLTEPVYVNGSSLFPGRPKELEALAAAYLAKPPGPRPAALPRRLAGLARLLDERAVDGVIAIYPKFSDSYLAEYLVLADWFRGRGLPALLLEDDGESGFSGQQRTRVEAFLEVLA